MQEGASDTAFMREDPEAESTVADQLHEIVDEMLAPFDKQSPRGAVLALTGSPPFDISKPNQHDTKAQFNRERAAVQKASEQLDSLFSTLLPPKDDEAQQEMIRSLRPRIDEKLREAARYIAVDDAVSIVRKNFADVGGMYALLVLCLDFKRVFGDRLRELDEQEDRFWRLKHRAPDYYAREIALRMARLFARETGKVPTLGTSPINGSSSTSYARAVTKAFDVLGIKSNHRGPAEWAVSQVTEADLRPQKHVLGRLLGGFGPQPARKHQGALAALLAQERERG